ncbi:oligosaccharide flippase family protein [Bdellovibrio bacteriovorus]|uniref:oligosaccharide flippase family protein n=1 Tax=Bdellovibrio bacteriovorus TaxID=959 RepID=UPI003A802D6D
MRKLITYALSEGVAKGMNLAVLLILPLFVTTSSFGKISLLIAFEQILLSLLLFGQNTAVLRFGYRFKKATYHFLPNIIFLYLSISATALFITASIIIVLKQNSLMSTQEVYLYGLTFLSTFLLAMQELYLANSRANSLHSDFLVVRILFQSLKFITIISLSILKLEEWSYPVGQLTACFIGALACIFFYLKRENIANFRDRPLIRKHMFFFGFPFLLHSLIGIMYSVTDRYMIRYYLEPSQVGIYSFSYTIGSSIFYIINILTLAYISEIYREKGLTIQAKTKIKSLTIKSFYSVSIASAIALSLAIKLVPSYYPKYTQGIPTIALVMLATCIHPIYLYGLFKLTLLKNSNLVPLATFFSFTLNIVLNMFLIPLYGITGAAIATLVSDICLCFAMVAASHKAEATHLKTF